MTDLVKILILNNVVEANLLSKLLEKEKIPFEIQTYEDTALDGLFQTQYGWGCVLADSDDKKKIMSIYNKMLKNKEIQTRNEKNIKY